MKNVKLTGIKKDLHRLFSMAAHIVSGGGHF